MGELPVADSTFRSAMEEAMEQGDEGVEITASLGLVYLHYVTAAAGGGAGGREAVGGASPALERLGAHRGRARAWRGVGGGGGTVRRGRGRVPSQPCRRGGAGVDGAGRPALPGVRPRRDPGRRPDGRGGGASPGLCRARGDGRTELHLHHRRVPGRGSLSGGK